jgi:hypothetical protein
MKNQKIGEQKQATNGRPDQANGSARQSTKDPGRDHSVMGGAIISESGGGIIPLSGRLTWAATPERDLEGHWLLTLVILRMVFNDRLPKALANRDVIEPLEWETRVHTGASPPQPPGRYAAERPRSATLWQSQ